MFVCPSVRIHPRGTHACANDLSGLGQFFYDLRLPLSGHYEFNPLGQGVLRGLVLQDFSLAPG